MYVCMCVRVCVRRSFVLCVLRVCVCMVCNNLVTFSFFLIHIILFVFKVSPFVFFFTIIYNKNRSSLSTNKATHKARSFALFKFSIIISLLHLTLPPGYVWTFVSVRFLYLFLFFFQNFFNPFTCFAILFSSLFLSLFISYSYTFSLYLTQNIIIFYSLILIFRYLLLLLIRFFFFSNFVVVHPEYLKSSENK